MDMLPLSIIASELFDGPQPQNQDLTSILLRLTGKFMFASFSEVFDRVYSDTFLLHLF